MRSIILFWMVLTTAAFATIRIVDGTGAGPGSNRYAKLSEAVTAAVAGDTVVFMPGVYKEGESIDIPKRLVILGSGYRNVENGGTHLYSALALSDAAAGNSKISGIRFVGYAITKANGINNVVISNNYFVGNGIACANAIGDTIRNNIFINSTITYSYNVAISNIVIANNIFRGNGGTMYAIQLNVSVAGNITNVQLLNNYVSAYSHFAYNAWEYYASTIIAGNIFYKVGAINTNSSGALLYSGNWLWGYATAPAQPSNGTANGSGDLASMFTRFEQQFQYNDDAATDTDLRLVSSLNAFPDSPIDGSWNTTSPLGPWYVDYLQQPGAVNSSRSDIGVYGGPYPFPVYGAPAFPAAYNLSVSPAVVAPNGTIQLNAKGTVSSFPGRGN